MKILKLTPIVIALSIAVSFSAHADWSSLKKAAQSQTAAAPDVNAAQSEMLKKYVLSAVSISEAQLHLANAFKQNELADKIEAEKKALESGAVSPKDSVNTIQQHSQELSNLMSQAENEGIKLDEESKAHYVKAILPYVLGLVGTNEVAKSAPGFLDSAQSAISSASLTQKLSVTNNLSEGMWLAKELPGFTKDLYDTTKLMLTFAKSNGVEVPEDATKALGNFQFK